MKTLYMLCGVPGSGKSTWTEKFLDQQKELLTKLRGDDFIKALNRKNEPLVLSTDDIIEDIAWRHNMTYNEVFGDVTYAFAERMMHKLAAYAFQNRKIIIWDQTNLTVKSRARKLARVPADWQKVAIVFDVPFDLKARLESRPGKVIPWPVVENMIKNYQKPTFEEGFDVIWPFHAWDERVNQYMGKK